MALAGYAAASTVSRKACARIGCGSVTVPSAATGNGGVVPAAEVSWTSVGRATTSGGGARCRRDTVRMRGVVHEIQGSGASPGSQSAIQAVAAEPSKALEAR